MATPTIEAIATQDITIDTDYALEIGITGDPEEVTVDGLLAGFGYSWDADNDTLTIAGNASNLLGDVIWTVSAKETPASTAVTREITYNIVADAPLIETIDNFEIPQGPGYYKEINILGSPNIVTVDGLLLGLRYYRDDEGVKIEGDIERESVLTVDSGAITVYASNDHSEDTEIGNFTIVPYTVPGFYVFTHSNDVDTIHLIRVPLREGQVIEVIKSGTVPSSVDQVGSVFTDGVSIFVGRQSSTFDIITELDGNFEDEDTLTVLNSYPLPESGIFVIRFRNFVVDADGLLYFPHVPASDHDNYLGRLSLEAKTYDLFLDTQGGGGRLAADEDFIYVLIDSSDISVFNVGIEGFATQVQSVRDFELENALDQAYQRIAVDNGNLYVLDAHNGVIDVFLANTDDSSTATRQRRIVLNSNDDFENAIAIYGNSICLVQEDSTLAYFYFIDKNTNDGETAIRQRRFRMQQTSTTDIAIHGDRIFHYYSDGINIYAADSANGVNVQPLETFSDVLVIPNANVGASAFAIGGEKIYFHRNNGRIYEFPVDQPEFLTLTGTSLANQTFLLAYDSDEEDIYAIRSTGSSPNFSYSVSVLNKSFVIQRTFSLPSDLTSSFPVLSIATVLDDSLVVATTDDMYLFDKNTPNGTTAAIESEYTMPTLA